MPSCRAIYATNHLDLFRPTVLCRFRRIALHGGDDPLVDGVIDLEMCNGPVDGQPVDERIDAGGTDRIAPEIDASEDAIAADQPADRPGAWSPRWFGDAPSLRVDGA